VIVATHPNLAANLDELIVFASERGRRARHLPDLERWREYSTFKAHLREHYPALDSNEYGDAIDGFLDGADL
jgi:hypothetical protein